MDIGERDQHVCPNGHEVPVLLQVGCQECRASVAYEPCSIGMALDRENERLRQALGQAVAICSGGRNRTDGPLGRKVGEWRALLRGQ